MLINVYIKICCGITPPKHSSQQGFTLISAMIGVGILCLVFMSYMFVSGTEIFVRKSITSKNQAQEVIQSLTNDIATHFSAKVGGINNMSDLATPNIFGTFPLGNGAKLHFDSSYYLTYPPNSQVPSDLAELIKRCTSNTLVSNTFYHFCLGLEKDPQAPTDSFEAANYGIVELGIKTKNLQTYADMTRVNYAAGPMNNIAGLEVFYITYWAYRDRGGVYRFHNKKGVFMASKVR